MTLRLDLANWPQTYAAAVACQLELVSQVRLQPLAKPLKFIGGADVSYAKNRRRLFGAIVVLSWPDLKVVEEVGLEGEERFPYIPGLLSFREAPILLQAWEQLQQRSDLLLVDGQGIAHPRRLGLATHLGLLLATPTIGCAKSYLWGEYDPPGPEYGAVTPLLAAGGGEQLGWVLRSRQGCRPLFISPGHLITLAEALEVVRATLRRYRLPLPLRLAHLLSNRWRQASGV